MDIEQRPTQRAATVFQSNDISQIAPAYVKAYAAIRNPERNRAVRVSTRQGQVYDFRYSSLDLVFDTVREPLSENGLALVGGLGLDHENVPILSVRLVHESGQWFGCQVQILVERSGPQAFGSALSYLKRYAVTSLLPLAPSEDDDANMAEGNEVQDTTKAAKAPGTMTGKDLQDEAWKEAFTHESYLIRVRNGDMQAWTHSFCEGAKRAPDIAALEKLWGDNGTVLESQELGKRLFNRCNKAYAVREAELKEAQADAA